MESNQSEVADWGRKAWNLLDSVRRQSPLIQCITNFVSMDLMANTLLSAGASPAMLHSIEEIPDFTPHAHALSINIGTLSPSWFPAMKAAAALASELGKPWVLDPVAVGASDFRMKACLELVAMKPTVIRGNGSEIIALSKASSSTELASKVTHSLSLRLCRTQSNYHYSFYSLLNLRYIYEINGNCSLSGWRSCIWH